MNQGNRRNANSRARGANGSGANQRARISKIVNATVPFLVGARKQMISIPSHSYQMKVRRVFRVYDGVGVPAGLLITTSSIAAAVRKELGDIAVGSGGEHFALFTGRFYVADGTAATTAQVPPSVDVRLYDISDGAAEPCAQFMDDGSPASIAHVSVVYPVQNRPTWNTGTGSTNIAVVICATPDHLVVDLEVEYVRLSTSFA
jgi:hypothetical protein